MTKRVLSLFLALVMALSLCVPAFAAEGDIAEAVESSEAGEPVAEAVDAPAEAAEDLPMLVALGAVNKETAWKLQSALDIAAEYYAADAAAGIVAPRDYAGVIPSGKTFKDVLDAYKKDKTEGDPFKDVLKDYNKALADAQEIMDGINGKDVGIDIYTNEVDTAANALGAFLGGTKELTKQPAAMPTPGATPVSDYLAASGNALATGSYYGESAPKAPSSVPTISFTPGSVTDVKKGDWLLMYKSNYLDALQNAINAVVAYNKLAAAGKATYSDYKTVVYAILNALVLEADAAKPDSSDMARVNAVLNEAEAAIKAYDKDVYFLTSADSDIESALKDVKGLKADEYQHTVEFTPNTTLYEVNTKIAALQRALTKKGAASITCEDSEVQAGSSAKVTVSVKEFTNVAGAPTEDGYKYAYAYQLTTGGKTGWVDSSSVEFVPFNNNAKVPGSNSVVTGLSGSWTSDGNGRRTQPLTLNPLSSGTFKKGDVITLYFYEAVNDVYTKVAGPFTIKVVDQITNTKAEISGVKYVVSTPASTINPLVNEHLVEYYEGGTVNTGIKYNVGWTSDESATIEVTLKSAATLPAGAWVRASVKIGSELVYEVCDDTSAVGKVNYTIHFTNSEKFDSLLKAGVNGKVTFEWAKSKDAGEAGLWTAIPGASMDLKLDSITEWSEIDDVQDVIEAAGDLLPSDYKVGSRGDNTLKAATADGKLTEAFGLIKKDIAAIEAIINNASAGNTASNHNAVALYLDDLVNVCGYLEQLKSTEEMNTLRELLAKANEILADDYKNKDITAGIYTFNTLGYLADVATDCASLSDLKLKSEVKAAIDALNKAIAGLKRLDGIDKSGLEAAIAAAKAKLADKDKYTEESWKAADLENAIKEAEAVLALEKPTQAQLTEAAKKLNAAVAKLVEKNPTFDPSDIPEKPTYGDHWAHGKSGNWYYLVDGKAVKNTWVMSTRGIWYYMDENGIMVTGVHNCVSTKGHYDEKTGKYNEKTTWSAGLYYFQQKGEAVPGRVFGGKWVKDANYGDVWAHGQHDGYYGKVEWTKKAGPITNWKN